MEHAKEERLHFLYRLFCPKFFFNIWVLSQCIVYSKNFQNIYIYLHTKKITSCIFVCLFLKSSKAFSVSLTKLDPKILLSTGNETIHLPFSRANMSLRRWCLQDLVLSCLMEFFVSSSEILWETTWDWTQVY